MVTAQDQQRAGGDGHALSRQSSCSTHLDVMMWGKTAEKRDPKKNSVLSIGSIK
jgi:hypothetical protein